MSRRQQQLIFSRKGSRMGNTVRLMGADGKGGRLPAAEGEVARLREENRRLAVSLGAFSAFLASRGLLEEAWRFVHAVHEMEDGDGANRLAG